jgi:hypothetical protein
MGHPPAIPVNGDLLLKQIMAEGTGLLRNRLTQRTVSVDCHRPQNDNHRHPGNEQSFFQTGHFILPFLQSNPSVPGFSDRVYLKQTRLEGRVLCYPCFSGYYPPHLRGNSSANNRSWLHCLIQNSSIRPIYS